MVRSSSPVLCITMLLAAAAGRAQAPAARSVADRQTESAAKMEKAAARQRAAAQAQTAPVPEGSFFSAGWSGPAMLPPPVPACPAAPESGYEPMIREAAVRHQLNPELIKAVIDQESGFEPCAISEKGAMGLMQLLPGTAELLKTQDPFDPAQNIEAGASYLKQMLGRFKGDLRLALAAYNAGPEKVDSANPAVPDIPETVDYVDRIVNALHGAPAETPVTPIGMADK